MVKAPYLVLRTPKYFTPHSAIHRYNDTMLMVGYIVAAAVLGHTDGSMASEHWHHRALRPPVGKVGEMYHSSSQRRDGSSGGFELAIIWLQDCNLPPEPWFIL